MRIILAILFGFVVCIMQSIGAAQPEWSVGLANVKITPAQPMVLFGYAARTNRFESVEQDLFAKALALQDGNQERAVLITMDLGGLPGWAAEAACQRIGEKTGVRRERILLNVSHTP